MTDERRHAVDPHPPDGVPERRHCSDKECMEARNRWFMEELLPKLTLRFWIGIVMTVSALSGVFLFLSKAEMRDFELRTRELFESQGTHAKDINRIDKNIEALGAEMNLSMREIVSRLDRNFEEIRERKR